MNKSADTSTTSRPGSNLELRSSEIMNAASLLFAEHGFHGTSTRRIASQAGISEGTLFNHFATKGDLLRGVLERFYNTLTETARVAIREELDTRARLQLIAENHIRHLVADQALFMRMIYVYKSQDLNLVEHFRGSPMYDLNYQYTRVFDLVVNEGIKRGDIREDVDLSACRDLFFGGLEYGMRTLMLREKIEELESYAEKIVAPIWQHMHPDTTERQAAREPDAKQRLLDACKRVERAARKLEKVVR